MPKRRDLKKEEILAAMAQTRSVRACARYMNCSYHHLKKWMKFYTGDDGKTLFEQHLNPTAIGIPKFRSTPLPQEFKSKASAIDEIIAGTMDASSIDPQKIKYKIIEKGYIKEECGRCGFHERRVTDYKVPTILHFKDGNKQNYKLDNLQMLCYNCYFLYVTNIFTKKELNNMEDHVPKNGSSELPQKWDIDEYTEQRLKELGLFGSDKTDSPYDLVSYK